MHIHGAGNSTAVMEAITPDGKGFGLVDYAELRWEFSEEAEDTLMYYLNIVAGLHVYP